MNRASAVHTACVAFVFCCLPHGLAGQETAVATAVPAIDNGADRVAADVASFDQVWQTIRDRAWSEFDVAAWEQLRDELRPRVEQSKNRKETRQIIGELINSLHKSHYAIIPSELYNKIKTAKEVKQEEDQAGDDGQAEEKDADEAEMGEIGVSIRLVEGAALVVHVEPDSSAATAGIRRGWELVRIKEQSVQELYQELRDELPETSPYRPETLGALALEGKLEGDVGTSIQLAFRNADDEIVTLEVPCTAASGTRVNFGNFPEMVVKTRSAMLDGDVGYVWFNLFFDPLKVMKEIRQTLSSADGGLVVDLRGNHGGMAGMTMGVGNQFVSRHDVSGEEDAYLGTLSTKTTELRFVLSPQARPYLRPVAVLVDECSISSAEILAGGLQAIGRARLFGVRTAGAALPSTVEVLPNADRFQYAIAGYTDSSGRNIEGQGVEPDEFVPPNRESLLADLDPALVAALDWIQQQLREKP